MQNTVSILRGILRLNMYDKKSSLSASSNMLLLEKTIKLFLQCSLLQLQQEFQQLVQLLPF